ncbi:MAG: bifunctional phosphopantothenoylcysteine decarboxylase/phosphopantothenate--cysteine ligase CoaBC [Clostridia bacterium]|nr:bifunctional phosphopantothenoylcysteine decarboxylase/phosphopantothenate--cysteine ligase CoaBC [Clostridia bacterium]
MSEILVGLSGGIACYKVCSVVSGLVKAGDNVNVIMTENATQFVSPLTLETLSHNRVVVDMFDRDRPWEVEHVSLAKRADICVVAPATADIIAKLAAGIADDMLTTTLLATKAKIIICPSMNCNMYDNLATQHNLGILKERGYIICEPDDGYLACGDSGRGRLPEPDTIIKAVRDGLSDDKVFSGKRFLITAGGTRESIDGVRYITNRSSGKMGIEIARSLIRRGAQVKLIVGTVSIDIPKSIDCVKVDSAAEMYEECVKHFDTCDCAVMAAAVGDYSVDGKFSSKIKGDNITLKLKKNKDIAKALGEIKQDKKLVIFCAETHSLLDSAANKLQSKGADMVVANDVSRPDSGFEVDDNTVSILKRDGYRRDYPKMNKRDVSEVIAQEIASLW